ncbi:MAG: HAD family phosphatase [Candidatus Saccharimonadales bacterium]
MKKFAVFDIDGTLIRWQLYHAVVDRLAQSGLLGESALQTIREARMVWKRRESKTDFHEYEQTLITEFEKAITNIPTKTFESLTQSVIEEYQDQVYTFTRDLITKLKRRDYILLAVSGSHTELVEKVANHYGFDDFLGTVYMRKNYAFTGQKFVPSFDKRSALLSLIEKHQLALHDSYAIGDSLSDASMLEMVENPIAFNPDQKLFQTAKKKGWKIVIERKNVVYQLEKKDEQYILV